MYDAKKRHDRYLKNQVKEQEQARNRYNGDSVSINEARRKKYHENIEINREKLRLRQQLRRAKLRMCQNDSNISKTHGKQCQNDSKQACSQFEQCQSDTVGKVE